MIILEPRLGEKLFGLFPLTGKRAEYARNFASRDGRRIVAINYDLPESEKGEVIYYEFDTKEGIKLGKILTDKNVFYDDLGFRFINERDWLADVVMTDLGNPPAIGLLDHP